METAIILILILWMWIPPKKFRFGMELWLQPEDPHLEMGGVRPFKVLNDGLEVKTEMGKWFYPMLQLVENKCDSGGMDPTQMEVLHSGLERMVSLAEHWSSSSEWMRN